MKLNQLKHLRWFSIILVFFVATVWAVSREVPSNDGAALRISSIVAQGSNIVLTANVPAGLSQVTLQMRSDMGAPWADAGMLDAPATGGIATYTLAKPGAMAFFRLKATAAAAPVEAQSVISSEVNYVVIAPLGSIGGSTNLSSEAVFHFKGTIDGSDKIVITREGALWEHMHWDWPGPGVTVNETAWNPQEKNYLSTIGPAKFLAEKFSLNDARLEIINGRDMVALERGTNALIVYVDDVQNGSSDYEFKVHFPAAVPKSAPAASTLAILKIAAQVDGHDIIKINSKEAVWEHGSWQIPGEVKLNDVAWSLDQTNVLKNEGTNVFLPTGIDFSTAKILDRKGRDVATMWAEADSILVQFADNPNGSDYYELEIGFGQ